jgi:hypothetical protein
LNLARGPVAFAVMERSVQRLPNEHKSDFKHLKIKTKKGEGAHQSSGFGGGRKGTGSVAVNSTHKCLHIAGCRTSMCHFLLTCCSFVRMKYMNRRAYEHHLQFQPLAIPSRSSDLGF